MNEYKFERSWLARPHELIYSFRKKVAYNERRIEIKQQQKKLFCMCCNFASVL